MFYGDLIQILNLQRILSPPRLPISPPREGVDAYIKLFEKLVNVSW